MRLAAIITMSSSSSNFQSFLILNSKDINSQQHYLHHQHPMLFLSCSIFTVFVLSLSFFLLYRKRKTTKTQQKKACPDVKTESFDHFVDQTDQPGQNDPTRIEDFDRESKTDDQVSVGSGCEDQNGLTTGQVNKKKKKRGKKKKGGGDKELEEGEKQEELVCLYPFTSTGSATQRKIKQQYDQLIKCNESKGLTLAQVGAFANCLIEARNELQHKSEVIQRKFTITKALLFKADRSSFDRLRQQIYKLEVEQKRLEEDAFVYNWLQEQLKLSPAYKKMLEISESMELKAKSEELTKSKELEFTDISFEELLAQEKKDSFWQKNGRARHCSG